MIDLLPCPFCEGPPVVVCYEGTAGDGSESHVFCHECGSQGPTIQDFVYSPEDLRALGTMAATAWNGRTNRSRDLYDSSVRAGRASYPRRCDQVNAGNKP